MSHQIERQVENHGRDALEVELVPVVGALVDRDGRVFLAGDAAHIHSPAAIS